MQKHLVPWLIALHGIGYSKIKKDKSQVSEMVVALCSEHKLLQGTTALSPAKAAELYPIAFADAKGPGRLQVSQSSFNMFLNDSIVSP